MFNVTLLSTLETTLSRSLQFVHRYLVVHSRDSTLETNRPKRPFWAKCWAKSTPLYYEEVIQYHMIMITSYEGGFMNQEAGSVLEALKQCDWLGKAHSSCSARSQHLVTLPWH